jgi:hypothetical protein
MGSKGSCMAENSSGELMVLAQTTFITGDRPEESRLPVLKRPDPRPSKRFPGAAECFPNKLNLTWRGQAESKRSRAARPGQRLCSPWGPSIAVLSPHIASARQVDLSERGSKRWWLRNEGNDAHLSARPCAYLTRVDCAKLLQVKPKNGYMK